MDLTKLVNVKNRSDSGTGYTLTDSGVRRNWAPGEIKKGITIGELEQVTFIPGGLVILEDYLLINDQEVCEYLGIATEPEYFYTEEDVVTLLKTGTLEQLLDCLDFAPEGVLDLVKKTAVELKVNDIAKRNAIKEKLGFDVTSVIANIEYASSPEVEGEVSGQRRSKPINATSNKAEDTGRRAAPVVPKYNVVK
ncbi:MAG: hypothetical protein RR263_00070 [Oscillospiraceae bacterium]